ncbi:unnamed protein product [Sphagnum balticum]
MNKTIDYLEEKNTYLEKFLGLNREWLDRLERGDFEEIESFRENRENILNIIKHLDALVETHSRREADMDIDGDSKKRISLLLDRKDSLAKAILAQDLDIMEIIEEAKARIITDLKNVNRGRKTIGRYKSFNPKDTIDEKA